MILNAPVQGMNSFLTRIYWAIGLIGLLALALTLFIVRRLSRGIIQPLREMEELAKAEEAESEKESEGTKAAKEIIEGRIAARVKEMREEILRTIQLWQRDVMALASQAEAVPANFPGEEAYLAEQAEGLSFAEAAARVSVVDEVRELLEHNIRSAVALTRLARALSRPLDR